jgi:uncharacterized protein (TIGR02594 family)
MGYLVAGGDPAIGGFLPVNVKVSDGEVSGWMAERYLDTAAAGDLDAVPPWLQVAMGEIGIKEYPGPADNPRIQQYHQETSLASSDDETSWCSSFVNWCMETAGVEGTSSAAARSWLRWGRPVEHYCTTPRAVLQRLGAVVVLRRGRETWQGHVTFLLEQEGDRLICLGGNQGNAVKVSSYSAADLLGMRWPA